MIKKILIITFAIFLGTCIAYGDTHQNIVKTHRFTFVQKSSAGILTSDPRGVLKGYSSYNLKNGDMILCKAYWTGRTITDNNSNTWNVYQYTGK